MCQTYGTWLPGDPKGFRTQHHREHIDGDYRSPPPAGRDAERWAHAKRIMRREPVYLTLPQRQRAGDEIVRSFAKRHIELKVISIDCVHLHALSPHPDRNPRHHMGIAKRECSHYMKQDNLAPAGGLWGVRCECVPIKDAKHFDNVDRYILDHESKGAAVWSPTYQPQRLINEMDDFDPGTLLLD